MGLEDYPKDRADHKRNGLGGPFAQRFTRLLIKQAAAQSISCEAYALLTIVAATEDAKRYRGPVAFYNEQLMMLLGFGSKDRLVKARNKAIDAGWLRYEEGAKSRAGLYFVCVPSELAGIPDNPVDESETGANAVLFPDGIRARTALEPRLNRAGTQSPYSTSTETVTKDKSASRPDPLFEEFWEVFPKLRRTKRKEALRRWAEAIKSVDPRYLIERAKEYAASPLGQSEFACMPSSWLTGGRWEDAPESWSMKAGKTVTPPQAKLYVPKKRQEATA